MTMQTVSRESTRRAAFEAGFAGPRGRGIVLARGTVAKDRQAMTIFASRPAVRRRGVTAGRFDRTRPRSTTFNRVRATACRDARTHERARPCQQNRRPSNAPPGRPVGQARRDENEGPQTAFEVDGQIDERKEPRKWLPRRPTANRNTSTTPDRRRYVPVTAVIQEGSMLRYAIIFFIIAIIAAVFVRRHRSRRGGDREDPVLHLRGDLPGHAAAGRRPTMSVTPDRSQRIAELEHALANGFVGIDRRRAWTTRPGG